MKVHKYANDSVAPCGRWSFLDCSRGKKNSTWITVMEIISSFCSHWREEKKKEITFSGPTLNHKNHHPLLKLCWCVICLLVLYHPCWGPGVLKWTPQIRKETVMSNFHHSTIWYNGCTRNEQLKCVGKVQNLEMVCIFFSATRKCPQQNRHSHTK